MNSGVAQPPPLARRRLFAIAGAVFVLTTAAGLAWWMTTRQPDRLAPDWIPSTVVMAGTGVPGVRDGAAHTAEFSEPFGVAVAQDGSIFVSDAGDAHRVRRISPTGIVTTIAGGTRGFADGSGRSARFDTPSAIALAPDGALIVADTAKTPSVGSLPTVRRLRWLEAASRVIATAWLTKHSSTARWASPSIAWAAWSSRTPITIESG